jgi:hypothetical protein
MKISCSVDRLQKWVKAVNDRITSEDISWWKCVGIYTNGAAALAGPKKGFQAEVR